MAIPYAAIPIGYGLSVIRLVEFELIPRIKSIINKEEELSIEEQMEAIAAAEIADAKE